MFSLQNSDFYLLYLDQYTNYKTKKVILELLKRFYHLHDNKIENSYEEQKHLVKLLLMYEIDISKQDYRQLSGYDISIKTYDTVNYENWNGK